MNVTRLCSELVKIRSENPPGNTEEIIYYLNDILDSLGLKTKTECCIGGRCNLVTEQEKGGLLLCGHVDVVPANQEGWSDDPFSGRIVDGMVTGRGSTDMKGGCAALICAYEKMLSRGLEPQTSFAIVCDEEEGGIYGVGRLLDKDLLIPADCIIAEPTPRLHPCIGQKGVLRVRMVFFGESGHSSLYPCVGENAIIKAMDFLERVHKLHRKRFKGSPDIEHYYPITKGILKHYFGERASEGILDRVNYNPGIIHAGEKINIIPERCVLDMDFRIPWGFSGNGLTKWIMENAGNAQIDILTSFEPTFTPPNTSVVGHLASEIMRVYGKPARPIVQWAATDARYLRNHGFDVVDYGPGEITMLHAVNEYVREEDLINAVDIYCGVMGNYCGETKKCDLP